MNPQRSLIPRSPQWRCSQGWILGYWRSHDIQYDTGMSNAVMPKKTPAVSFSATSAAIVSSPNCLHQACHRYLRRNGTWVRVLGWKSHHPGVQSLYLGDVEWRCQHDSRPTDSVADRLCDTPLVRMSRYSPVTVAINHKGWDCKNGMNRQSSDLDTSSVAAVQTEKHCILWEVYSTSLKTNGLQACSLWKKIWQIQQLPSENGIR